MLFHLCFSDEVGKHTQSGVLSSLLVGMDSSVVVGQPGGAALPPHRGLSGAGRGIPQCARPFLSFLGFLATRHSHWGACRCCHEDASNAFPQIDAQPEALCSGSCSRCAVLQMLRMFKNVT